MTADLNNQIITLRRGKRERRSDLTNKTSCFSLSYWQVVADVTLTVFQGPYTVRNCSLKIALLTGVLMYGMDSDQEREERKW